MNGKDFDNISEKIPSFVSEAIESMNFDQLNKNMNSSIQSVFHELNIRMPAQTTEAMNTSKQQTQTVRYHTADENKKTTELSVYNKNMPGNISSVVYTALGGTGIGLFGLLSVVFLGLGSHIPGFMFAGVSMLPFLGISLAALFAGTVKLKRNRIFRQYKRVIGSRHYIMIDDLASASGMSVQKTLKMVQTMMNKGYFKKPYLDKQKTCLILDDEIYKQYQITEKASQEKEEAQRRIESEHRNIFSTVGINDPEFVKAIEEGERYIRQIRKANDAIPGEQISAKLDQLEQLIQKIFEVLKKKPDQLSKLRRFMNYYMPTTLKLVNTYKELDAQPIDGENIRRSKEEIEKTLDTVNYAYKELLDSFFEDDAMDISSDISVLQTMLAQEGLTKNHFESEKQEDKS